MWGDKSKKKVLVIDDEDNFLKLVKLNLEQTGKYEVRVEDKGSQGLSAAQEFKPDLIFLDIMMPDVSGEEVIRQLKEDPNVKSIPVVFLTAIVTKDDSSSRGGVIGGHPFIAKPVSVEELVDCIEKNISE